MVDIKDILKTPYEEGGWKQKDVDEYMDKHGIETLAELVKSASSGKRESKSFLGRMVDKARRPKKKAHGGYVKKYAKGGGVRKVKT